MAEKEVKIASKTSQGIKAETGKKDETTADLLLDNFILLQKVLADVSVKLTSLVEQISSLLKLFEGAAKTFKQEKTESKQVSSEVSQKLDRLIEQNEAIARNVGSLGKEEEELSAGKIKPKPLPEFRF